MRIIIKLDNNLFKVGTLDTLIQLSDELAKADNYGESVVRKVANYTLDVLEGNRQQQVENLTLANNVKPNGSCKIIFPN